MNNVERVGRHIVRTFYDPPPVNDDDAPIWCLGVRYDSRPTTNGHPSSPPTQKSPPVKKSPEPTTKADEEQTPVVEEDSWIHAKCEEPAKQVEIPKPVVDPASASVYGGWPQDFLDDFESRIWMTYRSGFKPMPRSQDPKATAAMSFRVRLQNLNQSGFTSDTGFGCMIRSGQCILANALANIRLGRAWRRHNPSTDEEERRVLSLFADDPKAPFSIHKFVERGAIACGKYPGEWFGPSATARCIQDLANEHKEAGLRVYITGDGSDVYEDSFLEIAKDEDDTFHPTLILIGTRLGIDKITPAYWNSLKASLQMPQSMGIAGGRPSASHYFVGTQANTLFYLDPHDTRRFLPHPSPPNSLTPEEVDTCHTRRLRRIDIKEMDPSMLVAFLIKDAADWADWRATVQGAQGKAIIHIAPQAPPRTEERAGAVDEVESFDEHDDDEGSDWGEASAAASANTEGEVIVERPVAEAPVMVRTPTVEAPVVVDTPTQEAPVVVDTPTPEAPVLVEAPGKPES
ncbi:uncharacterized protein BDZ99DRAFT_515650 [Mytilinidion resinicola]|uniref:Cysteine protease n=1 Tax=Mytilinidion resinicola TaxID=574789 RepID=A0A6A6Z3Z5_9PEZI|nr:uncharacterized protein BDZ99DRAFT_515650 [Mytilinidion resinicola]KAF2814885.1 hypothetical protein BDZ99DRAFT_515650 [Mytilinidion resinicola]